MNNKQLGKEWCTKDDVMEDLAMATGGGAVDVDEHCLVYGERPPPRLEHEIDDEMKILFGATTAENVHKENQKLIKPDLKGIMSMIRMVETEENENDDSMKTKPNDILVISKLNPNVKEFIPKKKPVNTSPVSNGILKEERPTPMTATNNKVTSTWTPTPTKHNNMTTTEAEIMSLKNKILDASSTDSYQHKKEKNAAIAAILRHYTKPVEVIKEKPIKLYTPDFFQTCKATDFITSDDTAERVPEPEKHSVELSKDTNKTGEENSLQNKCKGDNVTLQDDELHTNLTPDIDKELKIDDSDVPETTVYELEEQQKSIAKVTDWLNGPNKPLKKKQDPVVLSNTCVSYKRKDVRSPSSAILLDKKISKKDPSVPDKKYVPSAYAKELRAKYETNKIDVATPLTIWDKVEDELKKKDEEIKKKKAEQE